MLSEGFLSFSSQEEAAIRRSYSSKIHWDRASQWGDKYFFWRRYSWSIQKLKDCRTKLNQMRWPEVSFQPEIDWQSSIHWQWHWSKGLHFTQIWAFRFDAFYNDWSSPDPFWQAQSLVGRIHLLCNINPLTLKCLNYAQWHHKWLPATVSEI